MTRYSARICTLPFRNKSNLISTLEKSIYSVMTTTYSQKPGNHSTIKQSGNRNPVYARSILRNLTHHQITAPGHHIGKGGNHLKRKLFIPLHPAIKSDGSLHQSITIPRQPPANSNNAPERQLVPVLIPDGKYHTELSLEHVK